MLDQNFSLIETHRRRKARAERILVQLNAMLAEFISGQKRAKLSKATADAVVFALREREVGAVFATLVNRSGKNDICLLVPYRLYAIADSLIGTMSDSVTLLEHCIGVPAPPDPLLETDLDSYVADFGKDVIGEAAAHHLQAVGPVADRFLDLAVNQMFGHEVADVESLPSLLERKNELTRIACRFGEIAEPIHWAASTHHLKSAPLVLAANSIAADIARASKHSIGSSFRRAPVAPEVLSRTFSFRMKKSGVERAERTVLGVMLPLLERLDSSILALAPKIWAVAKSDKQLTESITATDPTAFVWSPRWGWREISQAV